MALDGVYYRMDDNDATVYFNNRMQISIADSTITFQRKQQGATRRSGREDRRGKFEVRSQTRAAVKERESEDRRGASEDIA